MLQVVFWVLKHTLPMAEMLTAVVDFSRQVHLINWQLGLHLKVPLYR